MNELDSLRKKECLLKAKMFKALSNKANGDRKELLLIQSRKFELKAQSM